MESQEQKQSGVSTTESQPIIENTSDSTKIPETTPPPPPPPPPSPLPPQQPKKKLNLALVILILLFLGGLLLAIWYFQSQLKSSKVAKSTPAPTEAVVQTPQKIIVGTDATLPPMEFLENDVYVGYDIDFANFIGKELGAQVEFKNIVFDDLFSALEKKQIDMIISAVTITDERKQKYDFSEPYLNAGQVIITKADNNTIKTTADLKGKKIAVQKGTTNETEALKYTEDALVIRTDDFVQATTALVNGKVDAIFNDLPGAKGTTTANPSLKISSDPFTNDYYGIVFRKGDAMIDPTNKAIKALQVKGIATDLKQKWLD